MARLARAAALAAFFGATLAFTPARAGEDGPSDETLFGQALTAERGERLRLAAQLDPAGWPALRALARTAATFRPAEPRRPDPAVATALVRIDATTGALSNRLRPELRRAPLDALEALARAELAMLRAAEPVAPSHCANYRWRDGPQFVALHRAALLAGREAEIARLRAVAAALARKVDNPIYYSEQITEEQAQLREARLSPSDIATMFSATRPTELGVVAICRATIRYFEAVLAYPAELRATTLAYVLSGDHGAGTETQE